MMKKRQGCLDYNSAYTLIEVMLVLAIVSVVLISAQRPLLEFHRIAVLEQQKEVLRGDFQRFLLLLKSELIQAGYALSSGSETAVEISTHRWSSKQTATGTETLQIHVKKSPTVMIRKRKYSPENQGMLLTKH